MPMSLALGLGRPAARTRTWQNRTSRGSSSARNRTSRGSFAVERSCELSGKCQSKRTKNHCRKLRTTVFLQWQWSRALTRLVLQRKQPEERGAAVCRYRNRPRDFLQNNQCLGSETSGPIGKVTPRRLLPCASRKFHGTLPKSLGVDQPKL